jgi:hypothetical protein
MTQRFDPKAAQVLRKLFAAKAGQYPHLLGEAEILFENASGSQMMFRSKSPFEAAQVLRHIVNSDGRGIFNRELDDGMVQPISFRMDKRIRLEPDNKEHVLPAFNIRYQDLSSEGHLWISDPDMTRYYWRGEERIADKPPMTFAAPTVQGLITALEKAGSNWGKVNFLTPPRGRKNHLKIVK